MNPSPGRLGPPFIDKRGSHSGTLEVERCTVDELILWHRRTNAFNALPTCPPRFIGDGKEARLSCRRLAWPRHASELMRHRSATLAGCWAGAVVEPSRRSACHHAGARCIGVEAARRHAGACPAGRVAGCMGTAVESWQMRAWLRPRQCPRQGFCRGPYKGLAVASWSSPARILPGVLWISSARILPRIVVFWSSSNLVCL